MFENISCRDTGLQPALSVNKMILSLLPSHSSIDSFQNLNHDL